MRIIKVLKIGNERTATILKNIFWGVGIKGISIIISLALVPLTINFVSSELYGIWLTLSSVIGWLGFFDIGFGLGLRNRLTTALSHKDYELGRKYVSTTYAILTFIFGGVAIVGYVCAGYVDWCSLLNVSSQYHETLIITSRIVILSFCVNIVLKLLQNVCQAYQMTAIASGLDTLGQFGALVAIFVLTKTSAPNLNNLAIVFCFVPCMTYLIASVVVYKNKFKAVAPVCESVNFSYAKDVFNLGGKFFLLQIICIILYQATNFIISHYCGPEQVTVYNISYKYLNCSLMALNIMISPLWAAYNDAFAQGDYNWMQRIYKKLQRINILMIAGIILMIIASPLVYRLWIGDAVDMPIVVSILVGLYMIAQSISNINAAILNGMGIIKLQICQALIQGIIYIPLVIMLAQSFQLFGIVLSLVIVAIIPAIILPIQVNKLLKGKASGIWYK